MRTLVISRRKVDAIMARNNLRHADLAKLMDCSLSWVNILLRRETATPKAAGRLARGLGVDVSEILED